MTVENVDPKEAHRVVTEKETVTPSTPVEKTERTETTETTERNV